MTGRFTERTNVPGFDYLSPYPIKEEPYDDRVTSVFSCP